jgi:hypothetical protein
LRRILRPKLQRSSSIRMSEIIAHPLLGQRARRGRRRTRVLVTRAFVLRVFPSIRFDSWQVHARPGSPKRFVLYPSSSRFAAFRKWQSNRVRPDREVRFGGVSRCVAWEDIEQGTCHAAQILRFGAKFAVPGGFPARPDEPSCARAACQARCFTRSFRTTVHSLAYTAEVGAPRRRSCELRAGCLCENLALRVERCGAPRPGLAPAGRSPRKARPRR